jgi:hypothetical protein
MANRDSALSDWTPEQLALGKRWVETWRAAGVELERIRRTELRSLDGFLAISLLCGAMDYTQSPRAPRPHSGLVELQRWFMKAAGRE